MTTSKRDKKKGPAGLICAVEEECASLKGVMRRPVTVHIGNIRFLKGSIEGRSAVIASAGIGKANTAHAATLLVERFGPSCLINFGIGGAYPDTGYDVGDVLIARRERYVDEGFQDKNGFHDLSEMGIPLLRKGRKAFYNEFPADPKLLKKFSAFKKAFPFTIGDVDFLTVSTVSGTGKKARSRRDTFKSVCENMEGASLFHIAHIYGVPCCEVRGISNIAGVRDKRKWNIPAASDAVQYAVKVFLRTL